MNKKRITIGIIAAVLAVVCIVVFTQKKGPAGRLPGQGSAAGGQGEAPLYLDPDSPLALLPEEETKEASGEGSEQVQAPGTAEKEKDADREQKEEAGKTPAAGQDDPRKEQEASAEKQEEISGQKEDGSGQKPAEGGAWTEYDDFMARSPAEQDAFMESFESMKAFNEWLVKAREEWTEAHPTEELGPGGTIDLGK